LAAVYGESITGESAGQFLTGAIDDIVDYVVALNLNGHKYISYIYSSVFTQDDEQMVMKVHFGLVNNSAGPFGGVVCDPINQMYNPTGFGAIYQIESILNSETCNPNLRFRLRTVYTPWPSHPSNYNQQLIPGFICQLATPKFFSLFLNLPAQAQTFPNIPL